MASTKKTKKTLLAVKKTVKTAPKETVKKNAPVKISSRAVVKAPPTPPKKRVVSSKKTPEKPVVKKVIPLASKKMIITPAPKAIKVAPKAVVGKTVPKPKTKPNVKMNIKKSTTPVKQAPKHTAKPTPKIPVKNIKTTPVVKTKIQEVTVKKTSKPIAKKSSTLAMTQEPNKPAAKTSAKNVAKPIAAKTVTKVMPKAKPTAKKTESQAPLKKSSNAAVKIQGQKTTTPPSKTVAHVGPKIKSAKVTPIQAPVKKVIQKVTAQKASPTAKNKHETLVPVLAPSAEKKRTSKETISVVKLKEKDVQKAKKIESTIDQDELLVQKIYMNEDTDLLPKKLAKKKKKLKLLELDKLTDEDIEPDLSELPDIDESDLQGIDLSILTTSLSDKNRNTKAALAKDASLLASIKNDTMKVYMQDIGQISLVSKEEEVDLAAQIKDVDDLGHDSARNTLILANLRLVVKIAHDFKGLGLPLLDLISEGNIGLMRAVEKFDPAKGAKFSSYAAWWIKQSMRRALANQSRTIRIPVQSAGKINKIKTARMKLTEELGRDPTDAEIAEFLTFSERTVAGLRLSDPRTFSIHDPIQQGEDGEFQDIIPDRGAMTPDRILGDIESVERLRGLLDQLDEREQQIITMRFGLTPSGRRPLTLEEVSQEIGRTRERVRQIQNQALAKLRELLWDEAGFVNE